MSLRSGVPAIARGNLLGRRGVREIALIGFLYVFYCVTRTLAEDGLRPAQDRAGDLAHLERVLHLDWEHAINNWFVVHSWAAIPACYWYAAAHYAVTLWVLVWLYRKGPVHYAPARWALVVSCLIALACYLLLPTAPPRMLSGYTDVLSLHAGDGWWGTDASAPKGLGGLTNELAAFPSLHAGWALWVALVVRRTTRNYWARGLAWLHAVITALVVVGTGNHWILDVALGWALVIVAMWLVDPWFDDRRQALHARRMEFSRLIAGTELAGAGGPAVGGPAAVATTPAVVDATPLDVELEGGAPTEPTRVDDPVRRRYGCG
jgi:membrane-associated phospholipid phosphatase